MIKLLNSNGNFVMGIFSFNKILDFGGRKDEEIWKFI